MTLQPPPPDLAGLLQTLVQQQAALVQAHTETVRLQRLLIEHALGATPPPVQPSPSDPVFGAVVNPAPALAIPVDPVLGAVGCPAPVLVIPADPVLDDGSRPPEPAPPPPPSGVMVATARAPSPAEGLTASRATLYYQPSHARAPALARVRPQDLDLLRRLRELSGPSALILQFGPHKGATLAQVAVHHPEYIRQLVRTAQRPEVRAAASQLMAALEAVAEHAPRAAARRGTAGGRQDPPGRQAPRA